MVTLQDGASSAEMSSGLRSRMAAVMAGAMRLALEATSRPPELAGSPDPSHGVEDLGGVHLEHLLVAPVIPHKGNIRNIRNIYCWGIRNIRNISPLKFLTCFA